MAPHRQKLYDIIFGTDTPAGKLFDVCLIYAIVISVLAMMFDSVLAVDHRWRAVFTYVEWFFTLLFTLEYIVRIYCSPNRLLYMRSFYGVIDLLSILPAYLGLFIPGANYLLMLRLFRVLRIFRIFKLMRYISEANF